MNEADRQRKEGSAWGLFSPPHTLKLMMAPQSICSLSTLRRHNKRAQLSRGLLHPQRTGSTNTLCGNTKMSAVQPHTRALSKHLVEVLQVLSLSADYRKSFILNNLTEKLLTIRRIVSVLENNTSGGGTKNRFVLTFFLSLLQHLSPFAPSVALLSLNLSYMHQALV